MPPSAGRRWKRSPSRWRGSYGYPTGYLSQDDDDTIELCRIQYLGDPDEWAFAIWQASTDSYAGSRPLTGGQQATPSWHSTPPAPSTSPAPATTR